jgi:hypothetical protein
VRDAAIVAGDRRACRVAGADDVALIGCRAGEEGIVKTGRTGTAARGCARQHRRYRDLREKTDAGLNYTLTHLLELATRTLPMPRVNTGNVDKAFNQRAAVQ